MDCTLCGFILTIGSRADGFESQLMSTFAAALFPLLKAAITVGLVWHTINAGLSGQLPTPADVIKRLLLATALFWAAGNIRSRGSESVYYQWTADFIAAGGAKVASGFAQAVSGLPAPNLPSRPGTPSESTTALAQLFGYVENTFFDLLAGMITVATSVGFSDFMSAAIFDKIFGIVLILILVIPLILVLGMFTVMLFEAIMTRLAITIPAILWITAFGFDKLRAIGIVALRFYADIALAILFAGIGIAFLMAPIADYSRNIQTLIEETGGAKLVQSWEYWTVLLSSFVAIGLVPAAKMLAANFSGANSNSTMGGAIQQAAGSAWAGVRNTAGGGLFAAGSGLAARTGGGRFSQTLMRAGHSASADGGRRWIGSMERRRTDRMQQLNDIAQGRGDTQDAARLRAQTRSSYRRQT